MTAEPCKYDLSGLDRYILPPAITRHDPATHRLAKQITDTVCRNPTCDRTPTVRGLCSRCYYHWKKQTSYGAFAKTLGPCPVCGKKFASANPRTYCSLDCWLKSDQFRALAAKKCVPKIEHVCPACGKITMLKPWKARKKKFCSKACWRRYYVERFDRWIANPQRLDLPQNYDEFLTQEELPCLVDGCNWVGQNLSSHMNHVHGITASEIKAVAGFNRTTGLVTPSLSEAMGQRPQGNLPFDGGTYERHAPKPKLRREGKEHKQKAAALVRTTPSGKMGICPICSKPFEHPRGGTKQKYCSRKCKTKHGNRPRYPAVCGMCGKDFLATLVQHNRAKNGKPIVCGTHCRQRMNWRPHPQKGTD